MNGLIDMNRRNAIFQEDGDTYFDTMIITMLSDVVQTMAMQNIALQGEVNASSNFYQNVQILSRYSNVPQYWYDEKRLRPYHVTYMSNDSPNEFIKLHTEAVVNVYFILSRFIE